MGPKLRKKEVSVFEKVEKEILPPEPVEEVEVVPYFDLRYHSLPLLQPSRRPDPKMEKVLVLRKKGALSRIFNVERPAIRTIADTTPSNGNSKFGFRTKDAVNVNTLNIKAVNRQPVSKWFGPGELPMIPPAVSVLRRAHKDSWAYTHMLNCSFRKESSLLRAFEEKKQNELEMETHLMRNTGKTRQSLLIRKQQHLPHLQPTGQEISQMKVDRLEIPEFLDRSEVFCQAALTLYEKNDIRRTLSRREKGYSATTEWVGCPEITDIIAEKLRLRSDKRLLQKEASQSTNCKDFIPRFENLGLVGLAYDKVQKQMKGISLADSIKEIPKTGLFAEHSKTKYGSRMFSLNASRSVDRKTGSQEPQVGLIIGQVKLFWTRDPARSKKKWVIDLGCVAEIGKDSISSITMKNVGNTAVHFKWEKIQPTNVFELPKYGLRRFGFDCWGSVILPREVFRLPVLYKCIEPGFYSEDWRLVTLPVLENGAEIITRLWGITRRYDPYRQVRQEIDDNLERRMAVAVVDHRVTKIIDYLPLKEVPLKETRFPLVHLGPDLFHHNNPWLQYHCASVYRLGRLAVMADHKTGSHISASAHDKSAHGPPFVDEIPSDFSIQRKSFYEESNEGPEKSSKQQVVDADTEDNATKQGLYNDLDSVYSDEAPVSISKIKRLLEELMVPEIPDVLITQFEPAEDEADYMEPVSRGKRPLAVNLTNPDFSVDQLRQNIRTNVVDTDEHREAQFLIMSEQVTRLLFRTDVSIDNWKNVVAKGLLCTKLDVFSDFAASLKNKCCEGQLLHDTPDKGTHISHSLLTNEEEIEDETVVDIEEISEFSISSAEILSETTFDCASMHPRRALQSLRYKDQYYSRIFCRMYSLLAEYIEDLDSLLSEVKKRSLSQEEIVFTRVRNIPMNFSVEEILNAPLPPPWVKLAQRMDDTMQKNRAHINSVHDDQAY